MALPRILVTIASYRDTECQWTVRDLFQKAAHPERVFVGIFWQFVPGEDDDCFLFSTRPEQVRITEFDARQAKGACWARHEVQKLWQGEDYVLQIDSHMRFVEHWDEVLITMIGQCDSPKPVLTTYPPSYWPPDTLAPSTVGVISAEEFDGNGILKLRAEAFAQQDDPPPPKRNPFISAGMLFSPAQMIREVPYDPYLYFHGEEISLAVRLFTHGWEVFTPNRTIAFHDYENKRGRKRHWDDQSEWDTLNKLSFKRIRHILGTETSDDPEVTREIDRYGLGTVHTLAEYEDLAGVNFRHQLIGGKTSTEIEDSMSPRDKRNRTIHCFNEIYRRNSWGAKETRCGGGATMDQTAIIRPKLADLLGFLGVRTLADAGCGDANWIGHITKDLEFYLGYDICEAMLGDARKKWSHRTSHLFSVADVSQDVLPRVDAIVCRDVLTHFPDGMIRDTLRLFKDSGSRYLITTTFEGKAANTPIRIGGWQALDLSAAPFSLPAPRMILSEELASTTKSLGVWALADLA